MQLLSYNYENVTETLLDQLRNFYSFIFVIWPIQSSYVALPDLYDTVLYPTNASYR